MYQKTFPTHYLSFKDSISIKLIIEPEIIHSWRYYCQDLMTAEETFTPIDVILEHIPEHEPTILKTEVEVIYSKVSNNKATSSANMVAEMIQSSGDIGTDILHRVSIKVETHK